eukprot:m.105509 g.105509  ORF g.105509 m.105509 type:complete len:52 (-) comp27653_c0_seq1:3690-3845(-)
MISASNRIHVRVELLTVPECSCCWSTNCQKSRLDGLKLHSGRSGSVSLRDF